MSADDVPVAPLDRSSLGSNTNVYLLQNGVLSLVVDSVQGTLVDLRYAGSSNLLQRAFTLRTQAQDTPQPPWDARAWKTAAGDMVVLLLRTEGPPTHLRVAHTLRLPASGSSWTWNTRITALAAASEARQPSAPLPLAAREWWWALEPGQASICPGFNFAERLPTPTPPGPWTARLADGYATLRAEWSTDSPEYSDASPFPVHSRLSSGQRLEPVGALPELPQGWSLEFSLTVSHHLLPADRTLCEVLNSPSP